MALKFISAEWVGKHKFDDDWIIDCMDCPPWPLSWFVLPSVVSYRGACTVWHDMLTGKRAGTLREGWLCNRWQQAKWDRERKSSNGLQAGNVSKGMNP